MQGELPGEGDQLAGAGHVVRTGIGEQRGHGGQVELVVLERSEVDLGPLGELGPARMPAQTDGLVRVVGRGVHRQCRGPGEEQELAGTPEELGDSRNHASGRSSWLHSGT